MDSVSERLTSILDRRTLLRLAGERSYARGEDYHAAGKIASVTERNGKVEAEVLGTDDYTVRLWLENDGLEYSCDCPVGESGDFCKHCVAVALELLETGRASKKQTKRKTSVDVRAWLLSHDKEFLADFLLEQAHRDADFRRQLQMDAARDNPAHLDLSVFRKAIDDAVYVGRGHVNYRDSFDYADRIMKVVYSTEQLLTDGHAPQVVELTEHALAKLTNVYSWVDDSGGNVGEVVCSIQELHHNACLSAKPDVRKLAGKILKWEMEYAGVPFYDAADSYADVLGTEGLEAYQALLRAEWAKIPQLGPGKDSEDRYGSRYVITRLMAKLAEKSGDVDDLVAVLSRDLSQGSSYLKIAQAYDAADRSAEALEWAEQGVKAFPNRTDSQLIDFLAAKYHKLNRHDDAVSLVWAQFREFPYLEHYQRLRSHAEKAGHWSHWREKALAIIPRRSGGSTERTSWLRSSLDNTLLVRIFLWEKDLESAWSAAVDGDCHLDLWMEMAVQREDQHPDDSIQVYKRIVERLVDHKNNQSYSDAVELLVRINRILQRLERLDEFRRYLDSVRAAHNSKRNFMKLLDETSWKYN